MIKGTKEIIKMSDGMETTITTLRQENKDISAWLTIDGTKIDYAVCTSEDDYYKNHNQQHSRSKYGALYMTDGDVPQRVKGDRNLVIYGNNMADGSMFGTLDEYRKLRFFKNNPNFSFYFGDIRQNYCVFAVAVIDGENPDFDYKKSSFSSEKEFYEWHKKIAERSIIDTTVAPTPDDKFLTLVTDAYEFEGAKLVVMARLVGGTEEQKTHVEDAKVNAAAIYPQKWYNR